MMVMIRETKLTKSFKSLSKRISGTFQRQPWTWSSMRSFHSANNLCHKSALFRILTLLLASSRCVLRFVTQSPSQPPSCIFRIPLYSCVFRIPNSPKPFVVCVYRPCSFVMLTAMHMNIYQPHAHTRTALNCKQARILCTLYLT